MTRPRGAAGGRKAYTGQSPARHSRCQANGRLQFPAGLTCQGESPMSGVHQLKGRRIAVLAADGFEKVELSIPVAALRAQGASVDIVSLRPGRIRGVNLHEPASRVSVDRTLQEVRVADYDALFIPGGFI